MNLVGLKELRYKVDKYADLVNKSGNSYIVTRKGKPLFRLSPIEENEQWETLIDFTKLQKGGVDIDDLISRL